MSTVPSGTRFIGISENVNLAERKSSVLNAETQPYTIQDIADTVGAGAQGPQGVQGPPGPPGTVSPAGLEWRGAWVSGTSYVADDAVGYDGASYFCILATSGTTAPDLATANWALLASQGAQGIQGVQGPTGPQGPAGSDTVTLQQVLDNNHDLVDDNNFQGTGAGDGNLGYSVNAFGSQAVFENLGSYVNAFGATAAAGNSGTYVNAIGVNAALNNTGSDVNAFGSDAGINNSFTNVNLFGVSATADEDGQTVLSKDDTIMARISTTDLTETRKYTLPDADGTIALTSQLPTVAGNYPSDLLAAAGGVPVGGMYHTAGVAKIRLT